MVCFFLNGQTVIRTNVQKKKITLGHSSPSHPFSSPGKLCEEVRLFVLMFHSLWKHMSELLPDQKTWENHSLLNFK